MLKQHTALVGAFCTTQQHTAAHSTEKLLFGSQSMLLMQTHVQLLQAHIQNP